jgi:hypothetical protein
MMDGELTEEQRIKVADLIRNDLTGRFGEKLKFDPITVTTRTDDFGEHYCHIRVVYSGDANLLDPAWLNGFYRRNHLGLKDCGVTDVTTETYVDKTEDSDWSELVPIAPYIE